MYAMTGKLIAQPGKRAQMTNILLRAADVVGELSGCKMYVACEDVSNENAVWIFEMWDDKDAHDASLKDERVRTLIAEARPLMGGAPEGAELRIAGGYGL